VVNPEKIKKLKGNKKVKGIFNFLMTTMLISFIIMKLSGSINWSWLWVLSPIWIIPATLLTLTILLTLFQIFFSKKL
jgi:hypothetical protein